MWSNWRTFKKEIPVMNTSQNVMKGSQREKKRRGAAIVVTESNLTTKTDRPDYLHPSSSSTD